MRALYFSIVLFLFASNSFGEVKNLKVYEYFVLVSAEDTTESVKLVSTQGNRSRFKFRSYSTGNIYMVDGKSIIEKRGDTLFCETFEEKEYRYPFITHDILSPTALMLKKKQFVLQNKGLLLNSASVGLTDFATVSAGLIIVPGLNAGFIKIETQVIPAFGVKFGAEVRENLHIAAGYRAVVSDIYSHIPYVTSTLGDEQKRLTVGVQALFNENNEPSRTLSLSGAVSPHKKIELLIEGMYVYQEESVFEAVETQRNFIGSFVFRPHGYLSAFDIGCAYNFVEKKPYPILGMTLAF